MPRFATIDVGSNSAVLLVADRQADGSFTTVEDRAVVTRLGDGEPGRLSHEAMERTTEAIAELVQQARELGAAEIAAVGTAALREAVNAPQLLQRLQQELELPVRVIGGEEEARLAFLAARAGLTLAPRPLVVVDVGGASTEVITGTPQRMESRVSLAVGALSLTRRLLRSDPVTPDELARLEQQVRPVLARIAPRPCQLVGLGGAVTTLVAVQLRLEPYDPQQVHGSVLQLDEVQRQIALYAGRSVAARRELVGLHPGRADTILAGAVIVSELMARLGPRQLTVCDHGLRHGLMHDRFGVGST